MFAGGRFICLFWLLRHLVSTTTVLAVYIVCCLKKYVKPVFNSGGVILSW